MATYVQGTCNETVSIVLHKYIIIHGKDNFIICKLISKEL